MPKTKIAELEREIKNLKKEVQSLKDIEEIKNLQKAYGYYLEHWMSQEIIDLFSDGPDVALTLGAGTYSGKEGVKRYFNRLVATPGFIHQVMQLSGIVTLDPDEETAKGRWYGWGTVARPVDDLYVQAFFNGIYECEYIKEDGIWKILKLWFDEIYSATPKEGWVKPELVLPFNSPAFKAKAKCVPDIPRTIEPRYPSGYITPFSFKHPVTGKKTTEGKRNSSLKSKYGKPQNKILKG